MTQPNMLSSIVIRHAHDADAGALRRLAELDGAHAPDGDVLLAEVDGELRAALRVNDRAFVADPFFPSRDLVALLDQRAGRLRVEQAGPLSRARTRASHWRSLWRRASVAHPAN